MNVAERITSAMATWTFIIVFLLTCVAEISWNHTQFVAVHHWDFDPTTIILNLILSLMAAVQGSIIMIAQNAQAKRDLARQEHDTRMTEAILHLSESTHHILKYLVEQETGVDLDDVKE